MLKFPPVLIEEDTPNHRGQNMKTIHNTTLTVIAVAVLAVAVTAGDANATVIFEETFDTAAGADFFDTAPGTYGDWSEDPPAATPFSNPDYPVVSGQLRAQTPLGAGSFPNVVSRQITVPGAVADGTLPLRITFDSEIITGLASFGSWQGILLHDTLIAFHSAGDLFDVRDWSSTTWFGLYANGVALSSGAVGWDILVEQLGGGTDRFTVNITTPGGSTTEIFTTSDAFQFSGSAFTLGFMADDGSGAEAVEIAYDNVQVVAVPEPSSFALIGLGSVLWVLRRRRISHGPTRTGRDPA